MRKHFFRAASKGIFFLQKWVQRHKKPTKVPLVYEKRPLGPPGATPKKWHFWLKIGSGEHTLIKGQISPPLVFLIDYIFTQV